jgi:hypothetical protein
VFAKNVSVLAENVFVFARRCWKGLIDVKRGKAGLRWASRGYAGLRWARRGLEGLGGA